MRTNPIQTSNVAKSLRNVESKVAKELRNVSASRRANVNGDETLQQRGEICAERCEIDDETLRNPRQNVAKQLRTKSSNKTTDKRSVEGAPGGATDAEKGNENESKPITSTPCRHQFTESHIRSLAASGLSLDRVAQTTGMHLDQVRAIVDAGPDRREGGGEKT